MKKPSSSVKVQHIGLPNISNNCFTNVVLQTLFSLPQLASFFDKLDLRFKTAPVSEELQQIFRCLSNKRSENVDLSRLLQLFGWTEGKHEDTGECFEAILDRLEKELPEWSVFAERTFGILSESCGYHSLNVATSTAPDLSTALSALDEVFFMLPEAVFINVCRVNDCGITKSMKRFDFDLRCDLGKLLVGYESLYELKSVIVHRGSALSGHYKVYIKHDHWYEFNDLQVTTVTDLTVQEACGDGSDEKFLVSNLMYLRCSD